MIDGGNDEVGEGDFVLDKIIYREVEQYHGVDTTGNGKNDERRG